MAQDFSCILGGPFEAALRKRFGVGPDFQVTVDVTGGAEFQLGDYTWDTEPYEFIAKAMPMKWERIPRRQTETILMGDLGRRSEWREVKFETLPELWAWLSEEI